MEELARKLERLVQARAINIETREGGKVRHRGCRLLPLGGTEPAVGDLCRSVVVGKDEARRELVVHVTFLLEGDRSVFVNHLGLRGYIRDYDLVKQRAQYLERRVLHLHLPRQLQAGRARLRTHRAGPRGGGPRGEGEHCPL
jgi:hypothetical protein